MLVIVDYGGNLRSIGKATGGHITADPALVAAADRIILPGQGRFGDCRSKLPVEALDHARRNGATILGICIGMHLLAEGSDEDPTPGLGWLPGRARLLPATPLPHMGWNEADGSHYYFAHSYALDTSGIMTDYNGTSFPAIVRNGNIIGVQFHPEKSQAAGLAFLKNEGFPVRL